MSFTARRFFSVTGVLASFILPTLSWAGVELFNREELRKIFNLKLYPAHSQSLSALKVAVLDNGFEGYTSSSTQVPPQTQYLSIYPKEFLIRNGFNPDQTGNAPAATSHGLLMAQILWEVSGRQAEGPQFFLLNSNGMTNFRRAVKYAIEQEVDLILYAQNWEYGGNFDGQGFINEVVSEATRKGILWINAAGNYGGQVYNGNIQLTNPIPDQTRVVLPGPENTLRVKSQYDENQITVTLAWNDFQSVEEYQSTKDLDIEVLDSRGQIIAQGNRAQVSLPGLEREPTLHARERFTFKADRGEYRLRVIARTQNFGPSDQLRVTVLSDKGSDGLHFQDRTSVGEIMIPADHPEVITIGDLSWASARGPTRDGRLKPDFVLETSDARFTNGTLTSGTSNAAAIFGGILVVMKAYLGSLSASQVKDSVHLPVECFTPNARGSVHSAVYQALSTYGGIQKESIRYYVDAHGRTILDLGRDPMGFKTLYDSAYDHARRNGFESSEYRYFIAASRGGSSTGVDTQFLHQSDPQVFPDRGAGAGMYRWMELRNGVRASEICGGTTARNLWRTPAPDRMIRR